MVECQMKMEERTSELRHFRDALERFSKTLPEPGHKRLPSLTTQGRFEFGLETDRSTKKSQRQDQIASDRLTERVQLLQQVCE